MLISFTVLKIEFFTYYLRNMSKKATNHSTIPKPKKELTPYQRMMQYGLKKNNVFQLTQKKKMKHTAIIYKKIWCWYS